MVRWVGHPTHAHPPPTIRNPRERYKNFSQEENDKIKEYQRKKYQELVQYKKEALKNKQFLFFLV